MSSDYIFLYGRYLELIVYINILLCKSRYLLPKSMLVVVGMILELKAHSKVRRGEIYVPI